MSPDDELCLCFHVTKRKVVNFIRIEKPKRPAQLSECFGAGTGCGWCRPFLRHILQVERAEAQSVAENDLPDALQYAQLRASYREQRKPNDDEA